MKSHRPKSPQAFPNIWPALLVALVLVIIWLVTVPLAKRISPSTTPKTSKFQDGEIVKVLIGTQTFYAEAAATPATRVKGLAGRQSLAPNSGMLFIFEKSDIYPFTMLGMNFPLDILFIDNTKIVELAPNLPPGLENYTPKNKANYVLELNAGTAQRLGLKVGDRVVFP